MPPLPADVLVLGSGFAGSLTALLLQRIGLRPVLIEKGRHPRFAVGESATPIADLVLRDLADTYDLPRLRPLSRYGSWRASYPGIRCGLKRGFSYFPHRPGLPFAVDAEHRTELLVAASATDRTADTHWLRSDVDAFLVQEAVDAGIPYFDRCRAKVTKVAEGWQLRGTSSGRPLSVSSRFAVDATGEAGVLLEELGIGSTADGLRTHSRAIYAHFAGVTPWRTLLEEAGALVGEHPFSCDHAALHHVLEEGWMWQLRFVHGVTSLGFLLDCRQYPPSEEMPVAAEWQALLGRYPSLARQLRAAHQVAPVGGLQGSGRLQRQASRMHGPDWCLLPHTAGFIDPLHSTGIAHSLCGIERLVAVLSTHWGRPSLEEQLERYSETLRRELALIDRLVHVCYAARRSFRLFTAATMLYFAAATTHERRRAGTRPPAAFLCADDTRFTAAVDACIEEIEHLARPAAEPTEGSLERLEQRMRELLTPYNRVGLLDPAARNLYRYTTAPGKGT